jgi:hypothetical protein
MVHDLASLNTASLFLLSCNQAVLTHHTGLAFLPDSRETLWPWARRRLPSTARQADGPSVVRVRTLWRGGGGILQIFYVPDFLNNVLSLVESCSWKNQLWTLLPSTCECGLWEVRPLQTQSRGPLTHVLTENEGRGVQGNCAWQSQRLEWEDYPGPAVLANSQKLEFSALKDMGK